MKVIYYSEGKDLKKVLYSVSLLKNLKKEIYVFLNNFSDSEKLKKIKEKLGITFIISRKKINREEAIKILINKLNDDLLIFKGSINFNIKKLKNIDFDRRNIQFKYKSKILNLLNLNYIDRIFLYRKEQDLSEKVDLNLEFVIDKQFIIDILTNLKRLIKNSVRTAIKLSEKKIIKDLINEKIGFLSLKFFTFLLLLFLSRLLTVEAYGRYINFHSLVISLAALISLSIPTYKFFSEKKEERAEYLVSSFLLYFLNTLILFLILIIFKEFFLTIFNTRNILIIFLIILTALSFSIRVVIAHLFFSDLRFEINKIFDLLEGLLKFIFVLIFSLLYPTRGALIGLFFSFFILDLIEISFFIKNYPDILKKIKFKVDVNKIKELFKHGILINYGNILLSFYNSFRFNLISYIKGATELSLYFNALNTVYILASLFSIYNIVLPRIVRWSNTEIKMKAKQLFIFQFIIYLSTFLFIVIFSEKIIFILFGEKFLSASIYLKYSSILLFTLPLGIYYNILWLKTNLKEISIVNLIYLISFILLDIILIPRIGIFGAIISNIISTFIQHFLSFIFFKIKYN